MFRVAEVTNTKDDTQQAGRSQIRVLGDQTSLGDEELRWAMPMGGADNPQFGGGQQGGRIGGSMNNGQQVGSKVLVYYLDGKDGQMPIVIGSLPKTEDENGDKKEGSPPLQSKGEPTGYKDVRLKASSGDRTAQAGQMDSKAIWEFAHTEAQGGQGATNFSQLPEEVGEGSFSLGHKPAE